MQKINYIINQNYKLLYLDYLIKINKFIIFININKLKEIQNINDHNMKCFLVNSFYIRKLFMLNFLFLSSYFLFIFIQDINQFINVIKTFNEKKFCYSYKFSFSNFINRKTFLDQMGNYNYLHYVIFKLVFNIIILILFFFCSIIKFIGYKC